MKTDDIKLRINELIEMAGNTLATKHFNGYLQSVSTEAFNTYRSASLSFIKNVFGDNHPFYREFNERVKEISPYDVEEGLGVLKAAKQEIDGGWIFSIKNLVSAEIFSDFLEMSYYLLNEGYKDPAAVMIGSVLEENLRQLCLSNGIQTEIDRDGKKIPKKADLMNSELCSANVYNKLDQKNVTSWLDLRNKAAHGKYLDYNKEQVELMYMGVLNFISRMNP